MRFALPLVVFIILVILLSVGLTLDPRKVPSPLVGKPAPMFDLPLLDKPDLTLGPSDLVGQVWLLNVWASWCASCRVEHPVLNAWADSSDIKLIGLNYKDETTAAKLWLKQLGNPYAASVVDSAGRIGIDWGVYGVPETFVVDKKGIVRYKHIGPITWADVQSQLIPMLRRLEDEST